MKSVADSWMFRRRDLLGIVCLVPVGVMVLFSRPWSPAGGLGKIAFDAAGWFFLVFYATFRIWATLFAGGRKDRILQTTGPYSITRNPLYFGSFCLAISIGAFLQSLTLLAALAVLSALYTFGVVGAEERMLLKLFPEEYPGYLAAVPRFFPRFSAYRGPGKVEVDLKALGREAKRLTGAALIPVLMGLAEYLRSADWWPHYFRLF
jgi:protein-S-isoprenylcysteine O-methyltransferase Ste14